jgi:hypothetical protein
MIRPVEGSGFVPLSGATDWPADHNAAPFEKALREASAASVDRFVANPQMLVAADDAWVEVLAAAEQLRDPALPTEKKQAVLKALAENWRLFLSQTTPIAQMLEEHSRRNPDRGPTSP